MSAIVKFKINLDNSNLEVFIEENDATPLETTFAKKVLSLSTQLHFINFPKTTGIDIGSSIVIEEEYLEEEYFEEDYFEDDEEEDDEEDFDNVEESFSSDLLIEEELSIEMPELEVIDYVETEEQTEVDYNVEINTIKEKINSYLEENETLSWIDSDKYVSIKADYNDALKLVGGLTTPSSIATMMIYELLKRTLTKVEKYS